jgi:hypothetical protein
MKPPLGAVPENDRIGESRFNPKRTAQEWRWQAAALPACLWDRSGEIGDAFDCEQRLVQERRDWEMVQHESVLTLEPHFECRLQR